MFGFARVNGSSMEPTLKDGDLLLVRKSDRGVVVESAVNLLTGDNNGPSDKERAQLLRSEVNRGLLRYTPVAKFYERPPAALSGHVVVYKSTLAAFPMELNVKRVVGLGGQYVRQLSHGSSSRRRIVSVPDYSLFVQGDNKQNSIDSRDRDHGCVSKNLLVGIAEAVLWPPSRWQRIRREPLVDAKGEPVAYWL